jgi:hypothetical protein
MALSGQASTLPSSPRSGSAGRSTPTVLVLGFPDSVHVARWLNMVLGRDIRFVLLPVYARALSSELKRTRAIVDFSDLADMSDHEVGVFDLESVSADEIATAQTQVHYAAWIPESLTRLKFAHPGHVAAAVRRLRPDLVHSLVVQFGGYLGLAARKYLDNEFPTWLLSNWGSDIFLYGKLPEHSGKIREMLSLVDGYHAECERDFRIAIQMGLRAYAFPAFPASGGMDFSRSPKSETFVPPSRRREILVKGYHGWAGRALHILAAIHMTADILREFKIRINLAGEAVIETARALTETDGLDIAIDPYLENHEDALLRLAGCRMVIGLSISDGISTTLLEGMAVGAFPIQSCRSCGDEWIDHGRTGMLVSPHDVAALSKAIRRAAEDDSLVDSAAKQNRRVVEERWNSETNGEVAIRHYLMLMETAGNRRREKAADFRI